MLEITLPTEDRRLELYRLAPRRESRRDSAPFSRVAYAAAHVVADPLAAVDPWLTPAIDWERTIAFRRYLWSLGLGVAEAMDTAQRGMGLDWPASLELIRRSVAAAQEVPGAVACGAGTDQLAAAQGVTIDQVIRAYEEQCEAVEACGGRIILMASRALAAAARDPGDYRRVYDRVLSQVRHKVIIHWLGDMFDPALAGYWGHADFSAAMETCLEILHRNAAMRRRLPAGVRMYTGDDFNYPALIAGDGHGHSDALLGCFDFIAPAAAAALGCLARDEMAEYDAILAPTVALSRHIFRVPTRFYKTGVVFMAYLNGHQDHFTMVGGQQSARSLVHLAELFRLADRSDLLRDPALAVQRMQAVLAVHGVV